MPLDIKMLLFTVFFALLTVTIAIDDVLIGPDIIPILPCRCKATCANPNPRTCKQNPSCYCENGKIWSSSNGKCIPISDCPKDVGCNGDVNAVIKENPSGCQSTCEKPDPFPCDKMGLSVGCVCKSGYVLLNGKCVKADNCPDGNPCGLNATFVDCAFDCNINSCPENDSRDIIVCDPPIDCLSGCTCKYGYVRLGSENKKCIFPQECPPVKCTRRNEVWDSCPSACFSDDCSVVTKPMTVCYTLVKPICRPQCVCAKGFGRDSNGDCIPIHNCLDTAVM